MAVRRYNLFLKWGDGIEADSPPGQTERDELYNVMVMERDSRTVFCGGESVLRRFAKAMNRNEKEGKRILFFFVFKEELKKDYEKGIGEKQKTPEKGGAGQTPKGMTGGL